MADLSKVIGINSNNMKTPCKLVKEALPTILPAGKKVKNAPELAISVTSPEASAAVSATRKPFVNAPRTSIEILLAKREAALANGNYEKAEQYTLMIQNLKKIPKNMNEYNMINK